MIKEAAGYSKGKREKIKIIIITIFFQNSTMLQVWAFDVFYFLDNTLSITVFTLSSVSRKNYSREQ